MPFAVRTHSLSRDDDFDSVQKVHSAPTSRLGGAIADGIIARVDLPLLDYGLR